MKPDPEPDRPLSREAIRELLGPIPLGRVELLFAEARQVKQQTCGGKVFLRGIVELSNFCEKDCFYCGIRRSNPDVARYRMEEEEVIAAARAAFRRGYRSLLLQSGEEKTPQAVARVERLTGRIKTETEGRMRIVLSLGEQETETYRRWRAAGADRYLLRIETSSPRLYRSLHPGDHLHQRRLECLHTLRELGYQVGSGMLIGLPGQTPGDLADDALFLKEIDVDMIGMGPYIPHPRTPLARQAGKVSPAERLELGLKMIAVCRILMPEVNIAATTALGTLDPAGRELGLAAGANVVMPNLTPRDYRREYNLYQGKPLEEDGILGLESLRRRIAAGGDELVLDEWGDSLHFRRRMGYIGHED
jgi:biotin synthase